MSEERVNERRLWFSARELAGRPGMPESPFGVREKAKREGWLRRKREGRGGGWDYHRDDLPQETQIDLALEERATSEATWSPPEEAWRLEQAAALARKDKEDREKTRKAARIPKDQRPAASARLFVLNDANRFVKESSLNQEDGWKLYAKLYNDGRVDVPDWVRKEVRKASFKSLQRWHTKNRRDGVFGLMDMRGRIKTAGWRREGILRDLFFKALTTFPHANAAQIRELMQINHDEIVAAGEEVPALRTVQQWLQEIKTEQPQQWLRLVNPDKWRSKYRSAMGSASAGIVRLNQLWEMDSTPTDVILSDGRRHALVGVIDVYSRRAMLMVSRSSTGAAICTVLRRAMKRWGVPEVIRTDNGKDYVGEQVTWALRMLGVERDLCPPFAPERKPFIERFFKTFSEDLKLQPGFVGHNVSEREAIRARQSFANRLMKRGSEPITLGCSPEKLQEWCDGWCFGKYEQRPHCGLNGQRPLEMAQGWTVPVRSVANDEALDMLLITAAGGDGMRTVSKKGIRADGRQYVSAELGGLEGQRVQLRHDETNAGLGYVFNEDGKFLCLVYDPLLVDLDMAEVSKEARRLQAERNRDGLGAYRRQSTRESMEEAARRLHNQQMADMASVVSLPRAEEPHQSDGLDTLAAAAAAEEQVPARSAPTLVETESSEERFRRWYRLWLRLDQRPEGVEKAEQRWVENYPSTVEWSAQAETHLREALEVDGEPLRRQELTDLYLHQLPEHLRWQKAMALGAPEPEEAPRDRFLRWCDHWVASGERPEEMTDKQRWWLDTYPTTVEWSTQIEMLLRDETPADGEPVSRELLEQMYEQHQPRRLRK